MKRYAIEVVDYKCPVMLEEKLKVCLSGHSCYHTEKCPYQWGDTKGQLVMKVAQALLIDKIERYRKAPNCDVNKTIVKHEYRICLEKAQFIVEFLGVE